MAVTHRQFYRITFASDDDLHTALRASDFMFDHAVSFQSESKALSNLRLALKKSLVSVTQ